MSTASAAGQLIRAWRLTRARSQMALALDAGISPRHLSFVETGRARPSRETLLLLAEALEVPLRERNALLEAAGYARAYPESGLDAPELTQVKRQLQAVLDRQAPFGAIVSDLHWNVVMANRVSLGLMSRLLPPHLLARQPLSHLDLIFAADGLRAHLANWTEVARALVARIHREVLALPSGHPAAGLLDRVLAYPDVPRAWRAPDLATPALPLLQLRLATPEGEIRLFTTIATIGTPYDVTLQELRIESFVPADDQSQRALERLVA
jgi:transcriptional regulator with XRE-family HTH domain